ncbi:MAG: hypothetical protein KGH75_01610 [Rhodospirillales bacterium]|nr:hypothetical protein [Rhodospirillales bacterium]
MAARRATTMLAFGTDPIIVAYGMGVDSTAMLIGLRDRRVRVDLILFADTGSEKPETMEYLPVIQEWLAAQGMPPVTIIKRASPRAGDTSLHGECLRKSVLPSLAYGGHSCSLKWKVEPQWRYTQRFFGWDRRQQRWPHGPFITKLIGYDAGPRDSRRQAAAAGKWPPGHRYRYPLGEWGWTREICEQVIADEGLPVPVKSACWMCPASKRAEVDWLAAEHPDLACSAVEMERRAHLRGLRSTQGLGRRWSWSEHLGFGDPRPQAVNAEAL